MKRTTHYYKEKMCNMTGESSLIKKSPVMVIKTCATLEDANIHQHYNG